MGYKIGDKVMVKNNLYVDAIYFNDDRKTQDIFTAMMVKSVGKEAEVIKIIDGKYMLDIDPYHSYTDGMLMPLNDLLVAKKIGVNPYGVEADNLIKHMLELVPEQLIDYALDNGDKELFKTLAEKYYSKNHKNK